MITIIIVSSFSVMTNRQSWLLPIWGTLTISDIELSDKLHIQVTSQYTKDILQ